MKFNLILFLKGMAMGAADVIPGVSGGTIAFISGIYERLISALSAIDPSLISLLRKEGFAAVWKKVDGFFLLVLLSGIATSILSLAKGVTYLLDHHPIPIWSFFFGLIIASVLVVQRQIKVNQWMNLVPFAIGIAFAWWITMLAPSQSTNSLWFIFFSGAIAICAMILPGISGSFILVIMGKYQYILESLHELRYEVIFVFIAGCTIGLLSFVRLVKWLFAKYHDISIALLGGFMIGSLNKVWPWKITMESLQIDEKLIPSVQRNVSPFAYESITGLPSELFLSLASAGIGLFLILVLEYVGNRRGA
jgi:putative membrane protein